MTERREKFERLCRTLDETKNHLEQTKDNLELYKPAMVIKLRAAMDDARVSIYYDLDKDYKFIKVVLTSMGYLRKIQRKSFLRYLYLSSMYMLHAPGNFFKSILFFKSDASMAIYDYWKIKDALNQYNELEEHTLEILDTMEDMTDVYKKYMKCIKS